VNHQQTTTTTTTTTTALLVSSNKRISAFKSLGIKVLHVQQERRNQQEQTSYYRRYNTRLLLSKTMSNNNNNNDVTIIDHIELPKPNKMVKYPVGKHDDDRGALYLYGDPSCEKLAICCAGYADDHIVFQPFAQELSLKGSDGVFVGVMCLPGYDDRPQDGASWTTHNPDGYTFDDWSNAVRDAVKALRKESTYAGGVSKTKFTGIFHDWGTIAGTIWMNRVLAEATANNNKEDPEYFKPNNVVYFDVLLGPSKSTNQTEVVPKSSDVIQPSTKSNICQWLYRVVLAKSFLLQRYISKYVAAVTFIVGFTVLELLGLGPLFPFDAKSIEPLYKKNGPKSIFRMTYMAYPYWSLFQPSKMKKTIEEWKLHENWKETPILYLYGTKKRTQFHDERSIKMLENSMKHKTSTSRVIAVEEAGHFLYVQKPKLCVDAVYQFMNE